MPTAVFDFDGTLAYMPSSLVWALKVPLFKKLTFPLLFVFEKLTGKSSYQKKIFEWLVGTEVGETLQRMKRVPPVPEGLRYFRELASKGYRLVVMSYSPALFVESWLQEHGLSADVICPDFEVSRGRIKSISDGEVTRIYLEEPRSAKKKIAGMLNLHSSISVGDNRRRDDIGGKYVDIKTLQEKYRAKPVQIINNLNKIV
jgi:phosphoserine phosphatase